MQTLAQTAGAAGIEQCRDSLAEAARLLNELSDEASELHDTKELYAWIDAEQKKFSQDAPAPMSSPREQ